MDDPVSYMEDRDFQQYSPDVVPQIASSLPICHECDKETKPGEDLCWDCLGEPYPAPDLCEYGYYVYGTEQHYPTRPLYSTYPVAMGTSTYSTIHFDATSTVQVSGVSLAGATITFDRAVNMINGDRLQITYDDTIVK